MVAWYRGCCSIWSAGTLIFLTVLRGNDVCRKLVGGYPWYPWSPRWDLCYWWAFCSLPVILTFTQTCWRCPCHLSAKCYSSNLRRHILCKNTRLSALLAVRVCKYTIQGVNAQKKKYEIIHFCPLCLVWKWASFASRHGRNESIY